MRGNPYHISALYVVDLQRFRAQTAGDRLRGMYHALSADPNSLANLDQDLPNSMQQQIPIFTLDKDWLWCQTWCSDESLKTAKTIDLCQNPLTKEPKLSRARQIPEWDSYDREIAEFAASLGASELGGSVDELAGTLEKAQGLKDSDAPSSSDDATMDSAEEEGLKEEIAHEKQVQAEQDEALEEILADADAPVSFESDRPESKRKTGPADSQKGGVKADIKADAKDPRQHPADGRAAVRDSVNEEEVEVLVTYSDEPGAVWEPALKRDNTEPDAEKEEGEQTEEVVHDEL